MSTPPQKFPQNLVENIHKNTQFSTRPHIYIQQSRRDLHIILASRRDSCYNHLVHIQSRRAMYDDYDLDYTYTNDASYDLDGYALDLDEDYARDGQDYESLAYRHYA